MPNGAFVWNYTHILQLSYNMCMLSHSFLQALCINFTIGKEQSLSLNFRRNIRLTEKVAPSTSYVLVFQAAKNSKTKLKKDLSSQSQNDFGKLRNKLKKITLCKQQNVYLCYPYIMAEDRSVLRRYKRFCLYGKTLNILQIESFAKQFSGIRKDI